VARRAKFAEAAEAWLRAHPSAKAVSTDELWKGLCRDYSQLTAASENRKTPRTTCMRDLRKDGAFVVADRKVSLR
jgi:hypothetical protein